MPESLMRVLLMTMTVAAGVGSSVQAQQSGTPADETAARQPADTLRKLTEQPEVRVAALERLARAGDTAARDALVRTAGGAGSAPETARALASLVRLGDKSAAGRAFQLLPRSADPTIFIEALVDARVAEAGPALVGLLQDDDPVVRSEAAIAVGLIGYSDGAQALRQALDDRWGTVRAGAAVGLWRLGDRSVKPILDTLVGVPSPEILLTASRAWAPDTDGAWVAEVQRLLRNPAWELRHPAIERLHRLRPADARDALSHDLAHGMPAEVRANAARIFERIATPADRPALRPLTADADPEVQVHAAGGLLRLAALANEK